MRKKPVNQGFLVSSGVGYQCQLNEFNRKQKGNRSLKRRTRVSTCTRYLDSADRPHPDCDSEKLRERGKCIRNNDKYNNRHYYM